MNFVQIGVPTDQPETSYACTATNGRLPYQSIWRITQSSLQHGSIRLIPDLSIHLVFDLSGILAVEPLLIYTGANYVDLDLPAGVQLVGMQFVVWEALQLREDATEQPAIYDICFDVEWVHLLYFTLLDALNTGLSPDDELNSLAQFSDWISSSLRKDFNSYFFQVSAGSESHQSLGYSQRHERRIYHAITGMPPAQFQRIVRFQKTLQCIRAAGRLSWDEYYDQAHFIREFKNLAGLTPAVFLQRYCT